MRFLDNVKIRTRILATILLMGIGLCFVGWLGVNAIQTYDRRLEDLNAAAHRALLAQKYNSAVFSVVMDSRGIYHARDIAEAKRFAKPLLAELAWMEQNLPGYEASQKPEYRAEFQQQKKTITEFIAFRRELARLGSEAGPVEADRFGNNDANRANRQALNRDLVAAVTRNDEELATISSELQNFKSEQMRLILALSGLVLVAALGAGLALASLTISRPITRLSSGMQALADGDTGVEVFGAGRGDEIGAMARTVQVFKDNMIARARAEADIARQREESEAQRAAREARERRAIEEISALCEKAVAGDLSMRIEESGKEGFLLTISQRLN